MQYILSEVEYQEYLSNLKKLRDFKNPIIKEKDLLQLCRDVANHKPIIGSWGKWEEEPYVHPWGCIMDSEEEWYCDECPVQHLCPGDKNWSQ